MHRSIVRTELDLLKSRQNGPPCAAIQNRRTNDSAWRNDAEGRRRKAVPPGQAGRIQRLFVMNWNLAFDSIDRVATDRDTTPGNPR
jgi:hypothetical protein